MLPSPAVATYTVTDFSEAMLKEAIAEVTSTMLAAS